MALENVDVIELQSRQALVDALCDPLGAEIEALDVPPALCGDDELVPGDAESLKAVAKDRLRDRAPIIPRRKKFRNFRGEESKLGFLWGVRTARCRRS